MKISKKLKQLADFCKEYEIDNINLDQDGNVLSMKFKDKARYVPKEQSKSIFDEDTKKEPEPTADEILFYSSNIDKLEVPKFRSVYSKKKDENKN